MNLLAAQRSAPALHDLLGISFVFNSAIRALAWDRDFACFGLADGAIAILRAHWEGAPKLTAREGGGVVINAGTAPPPPPAIFKTHAGSVLALAAVPTGGVLSGGDDGKLCRLLEGSVTVMDTRPRRTIAAIAAGRGARWAFAAGRNVEISGAEDKRLSMPSRVTALAYDPSGLFLAVGFEGGVSLEVCGLRRAPKFESGGTHYLLAWRQDGGAIAVAGANCDVALRDRASDDWQIIADLPGPPTALAFTAQDEIVIGGVDFVHIWNAGSGTAPFGGGANGVAIGPVACHPRLNLFAYVTVAGAILIGRPGTAEGMMVRDSGARVAFMSFSPEGDALAFAAVDGEAGTVMLPNILFR